MSRCTNSTACMHDPECSDVHCPGRPAKVAKVHAPRIPREPVPLRQQPQRGFGLRVLWLHAARVWYRWAERDMGPTHRDLPEVIHKLRAIERELQGMSS